MYSPGPMPPNPDVRQLAAHVEQEKQSLAKAQSDPLDCIQFNVLHAEPKRPRDGMVAFADGTDWAPGVGGGLYQRVAGAWVKL